MKQKNIIISLLVLLTLSLLFTGCSTDDNTENTIGTGNDVNTDNENAPVDNSNDDSDDNSNDETVDDILEEDDAEEDVEIGSLI